MHCYGRPAGIPTAYLLHVTDSSHCLVRRGFHALVWGRRPPVYYGEVSGMDRVRTSTF